MLSNKKLLLVLDLDHTLLNSTRFDEVRTALYLSCHKIIGKLPCWSSFWHSLVQAVGFEEQLAAIQQARSKDEPESLYRKEHMRLWTKLRPYVRVLRNFCAVVASIVTLKVLQDPSKRTKLLAIIGCAVEYTDCQQGPNERKCNMQEFLEKAHEVSEMHIYTHGNAEYAIEMARLLDPTKRFFAERIISQVWPPSLHGQHAFSLHSTDHVLQEVALLVLIFILQVVSARHDMQGDSTVKHVKDLDVVLGAEKAVVIMDDTAGVWPSHLQNLLQVHRNIPAPPPCAIF